jgi:SAM-dependent methyltransferase
VPALTPATSRYGGADTRYVVAFQQAASPAWLHLALALADTAWEPADRDRLTVLDLGCGRGLTACLLAAANPGWQVVGVDLQPAHVAEATEVAAAAGLDNLRFLEADLAAPDAAAALPPADIVLCHGVWTWVSDAVRAGIVRLLKARVKPGGLVLMGYNALPGYADSIALQRILLEAGRTVSGTDAERGAHALAVLERLRAAGSPHLPRPAVLDHIVATARAAPAYMAHEWFSPFWRPVFHADLARDMATARLDYGGTTRPGASQPALQLRPAQRAALSDLPAAMDAETATDLFLERRFRSDIFIRGRRAGGRAGLGAIRFALLAEPPEPRIGFTTQAGVANLEGPPAAAVLDALAAGPRALGDLARLAGLSIEGLALLLTESRVAAPLWRDVGADPAAAARAARCNAVTLDRFGGEVFAGPRPLGAVAPALGSALGVSAANLAAVVALQSGVPADAAALAPRLAPFSDTPAAANDAALAVLAGHHGPWRRLGLL